MRSIPYLQKPLIEWLVFLFSIATLSFWISAWYLIANVYKQAIVGALYEFLSIPMLAGIFILPFVSFLQVKNYRYKPGTLAFFSLLMNTILIFLFVLQVIAE